MVHATPNKLGLAVLVHKRWVFLIAIAISFIEVTDILLQLLNFGH